ncbi:MAG: RNA methyltransferase [Candidatus Magnetoovum sp. WYHC-5]|nr:RNA methyltransferase [Candidatus Magnetoovum sp. WYHC-5]
MVKDNISFILVEPKDAGNIGSAARAIKNMGFSKLGLVNPVSFPTMTSFALAHGAEDVLASATVYTSVDEAVKDVALVVGTTRRLGKIRGVLLHVKEAASIINSVGRHDRVAILFGREDKGLSNEELLRCGYIVKIPTDTAQPSLNLAQAVLLTAYELFGADMPQTEGYLSNQANQTGLATQEETKQLYVHFQKTLKLLDFGARGSEDLRASILRNIRRIFGRFGLFHWEVNMLHGICTQIEKKLKERYGNYE